MSIFGRIERRASAAGSKAAWDKDVEVPARSTSSGVSINPETARKLAAVYACQSLIADGVASLPVDTFRKVKKKGKREALENPSWIENPNPFDTWYSFAHKLIVSLVGQDGNGFILTPRDAKDQVVSVWALDPATVEIDENSPVPLYTIDGQEYGPKEILHIPAFTVPGKRRGLSIIDHAREAIGLGLAAEEFGARFFSQGTTMSGVVEHPGNPKPGEVAVIAKTLRKTHSGVKNSHAVGILTGGASWKQISITPEQAQFLETRRFQNIQIAQLYRVPPHMVDPSVQSSWGSGVEEQNKFFIEYTLVPWLIRLEQAFKKLLPNGQYIRFNVDARMRAKTLERFTAYVQAVNNGIYNLDEVRALEDMEPIPAGKGKVYVRPLNLNELGKDPPGSKPAEKEEPPANSNEEESESDDD